jgi:hypothetical protein
VIISGVMTWVSSPRARRRLLWLGALAAAGAIATIVVALLPNDKGGISTPTSNEPVQRIRGERQVSLSKASRVQINTLLDRFVPAAVARRDPAAAYDLVTPSLRAQTTRADWASGSIPAPTYDPSGTEFRGWRVVLSYPNQASIELTLQPGKTERDPAAFFVDLKRIKSRWLVDGIYQQASFATSSGSTATAKTETGAFKRPIGGSRGRLGAIWFLVPLGLLSLIVIVPAVIFLAGWIADRRVARKYRDGQSKELPPLPRRSSPDLPPLSGAEGAGEPRRT